MTIMIEKYRKKNKETNPKQQQTSERSEPNSKPQRTKNINK